MTADYRDILPGKEFDRYFPKPTNTHKVAVDLGDVFDTIVEMQAVVDSSLEDTKKIAKTFASSSVEQTCRKIFAFCYNHIQYEQDEDGIEQLRTPARIWADRTRGVDCDDYAIFVASILTNLNIPCYFRMTKYNGKEHYQHIYIIVPKATGLSLNNKGNYYVIDPVVDRFNYEVPFSQKHDKKVMMPIHVLSGIGEADAAKPYNPLLDDLGGEFDNIGESLKGLGSVDDATVVGEEIETDFLVSMKKHLINTDKMLETMPDTVMDEETKRFKTRIEYLLHNFDDPVKREAALQHLERVEELEEGLQGLGFLKKVGGFFKKVGQGIVDVAKAVVKGISNAAKWVADKVVDAVEATWEGIKNAAKWTARAATKVWDGIKEAAKEVGKFIVRFNPLFIAIRNGILLAMKINLFRMAERMGYGYWTEEEAQAKGLDMPNYRKMKDKLDWLVKKFKQMQGKEENLEKAIMQGWDKGTKKRNLVRGLGAGLAATIATAMSVISALLGMIKGILPAKGTNPEDYSDDYLSEEELERAANAVDNQTYNPDIPFMLNEQAGNMAMTTGNSGMLMMAAGGLLLLGFAMKKR